MTTSEDATMAESGDPATRFRLVSHTQTTKKPKDSNLKDNPIEYEFNYQM